MSVLQIFFFLMLKVWERSSDLRLFFVISAAKTLAINLIFTPIFSVKRQARLPLCKKKSLGAKTYLKKQFFKSWNACKAKLHRNIALPKGDYKMRCLSCRICDVKIIRVEFKPKFYSARKKHFLAYIIINPSMVFS